MSDLTVQSEFTVRFSLLKSCLVTFRLSSVPFIHSDHLMKALHLATEPTSDRQGNMAGRHALAAVLLVSCLPCMHTLIMNSALINPRLTTKRQILSARSTIRKLGGTFSFSMQAGGPQSLPLKTLLEKFRNIDRDQRGTLSKEEVLGIL